MSGESAITEVHRERWRRVRGSMRLLDPQAKDFAEGRLSRIVKGCSVRMLMLSGDPEANYIEFDGEFWKWWLSERKDPVTGGVAYWGSAARPTLSAALRGDSRGNGQFTRFVALRRDGGLEMALGSEGVYSLNRQRETLVFRLTLVVGRVWAALELYHEVIQHFSLKGPWEICLAIPNTAGSMLGGLGEGWAEPAEYYGDLPPCDEPGLLLRREISQFPDAEGIQALAFSFGAQLEDAWGRKERRFLARHGEFAGQFDRSRCSWY